MKEILMDALCFDFLNSEFRDFRGRWIRDDLLQPGWLEQFLEKWDLQAGPLPDEATLAELVALRSLLQRVVEEVVEGGSVAEPDLVVLNTILRQGVASRRLAVTEEGYRLEMEPLARDWNWVQAEIVASLAHVLAAYDPRRLRVCANAYCRWIFYDETKSRTRRYCTSDKCANLLKVRRFRERHSLQT